MKKRVLVTGFGPWADNTHNPSTDLARAMHGIVIGDIEFVAHAPLPVAFEKAEHVAHDEATQHQAILHLALGLAAATPYVRIERYGRNRSTTETPDNLGTIAHDVVIENEGPDIVETTLDVAAIARALIANNIDAQVSEDAGGYVCNDLYYRSLRRGAALTPTRHALFVHVPKNAHEIKALPSALAHAIAKCLGVLDK